jgi:hypothetical protein
LKGVVWGDAVSVERWLEDIGKITASERVILNAYRAGSAEVKTAMELIAKTGVADQPRVRTQTFNGEVGQVIHGGQTVAGALNIQPRHEGKRVKKTDKKV